MSSFERQRGLLAAIAAFVAACLFAAALLFRPVMTPAERASYAAQFADRHAYPDARLRDMEETADPDMDALVKAEMARRGVAR